MTGALGRAIFLVVGLSTIFFFLPFATHAQEGDGTANEICAKWWRDNKPKPANQRAPAPTCRDTVSCGIVSGTLEGICKVNAAKDEGQCYGITACGSELKPPTDPGVVDPINPDEPLPNQPPPQTGQGPDLGNAFDPDPITPPTQAPQSTGSIWDQLGDLWSSNNPYDIPGVQQGMQTPGMGSSPDFSGLNGPPGTLIDNSQPFNPNASFDPAPSPFQQFSDGSSFSDQSWLQPASDAWTDLQNNISDLWESVWGPSQLSAELDANLEQALRDGALEPGDTIRVDERVAALANRTANLQDVFSDRFPDLTSPITPAELSGARSVFGIDPAIGSYTVTAPEIPSLTSRLDSIFEANLATLERAMTPSGGFNIAPQNFASNYRALAQQQYGNAFNTTEGQLMLNRQIAESFALQQQYVLRTQAQAQLFTQQLANLAGLGCTNCPQLTQTVADANKAITELRSNAPLSPALETQVSVIQEALTPPVDLMTEALPIAPEQTPPVQITDLTSTPSPNSPFQISYLPDLNQYQYGIGLVGPQGYGESAGSPLAMDITTGSNVLVSDQSQFGNNVVAGPGASTLEQTGRALGVQEARENLTRLEARYMSTDRPSTELRDELIRAQRDYRDAVNNEGPEQRYLRENVVPRLTPTDKLPAGNTFVPDEPDGVWVDPDATMRGLGGPTEAEIAASELSRLDANADARLAEIEQFTDEAHARGNSATVLIPRDEMNALQERLNAPDVSNAVQNLVSSGIPDLGVVDPFNPEGRGEIAASLADARQVQVDAEANLDTRTLFEEQVRDTWIGRTLGLDPSPQMVAAEAARVQMEGIYQNIYESTAEAIQTRVDMLSTEASIQQTSAEIRSSIAAIDGIFADGGLPPVSSEITPPAEWSGEGYAPTTDADLAPLIEADRELIALQEQPLLPEQDTATPQTEPREQHDVIISAYYPGVRCIRGVDPGCSPGLEGAGVGNRGNEIDWGTPVVAAGPNSGLKFGDIVKFTDSTGVSRYAVVGDICPACSGVGNRPDVDLPANFARELGWTDGHRAMKIELVSTGNSWNAGLAEVQALNSPNMTGGEFPQTVAAVYSPPGGTSPFSFEPYQPSADIASDFPSSFSSNGPMGFIGDGLGEIDAPEFRPEDSPSLPSAQVEVSSNEPVESRGFFTTIRAAARDTFDNWFGPRATVDSETSVSFYEPDPSEFADALYEEPSPPDGPSLDEEQPSRAPTQVADNSGSQLSRELDQRLNDFLDNAPPPRTEAITSISPERQEADDIVYDAMENLRSRSNDLQTAFEGMRSGQSNNSEIAAGYRGLVAAELEMREAIAYARETGTYSEADLRRIEARLGGVQEPQDGTVRASLNKITGYKDYFSSLSPGLVQSYWSGEQGIGSFIGNSQNSVGRIEAAINSATIVESTTHIVSTIPMNSAIEYWGERFDPNLTNPGFAGAARYTLAFDFNSPPTPLSIGVQTATLPAQEEFYETVSDIPSMPPNKGTNQAIESQPWYSRWGNSISNTWARWFGSPDVIPAGNDVLEQPSPVPSDGVPPVSITETSSSGGVIVRTVPTEAILPGQTPPASAPDTTGATPESGNVGRAGVQSPPVVQSGPAKAPPGTQGPGTRTTDTGGSIFSNLFGGSGNMGANLNALGQLMQMLGMLNQQQQNQQPQYPQQPPLVLTPTPTQPTQPGTTTTPTPSTPAPSVALVANPSSIPVGTTSRLTWTSFRATECVVKKGSDILVTGGATGSVRTPTLSVTTTYTLTCGGAGGTKSASATVYVGEQAPSTNTTSAPAPTLQVTTGTGATATSPTQTKSTTQNNSDYCDPGLPIDAFINCLNALPGSSQVIQ